MINFGAVPASSVLPIFFDTFAASTGAPTTISNFATSDIQVYKGTSMTQRASTAGFTLLDTDGIDLDATTGINGFSIDLGDNTDAGFYAVGSFYTVVVATITADSQSLNFIAATFRIVAAESVAGKPKVDVDAFGGTAGTFASGRPEVNTSHIAGSSVSTSSAQIGVNVVNAGGTGWGSGAITAASIASSAITSAKFAAGAIDAAAIATNAIDADAIAADAVTEIQSGLSTLNAAGIRTAVGLASANLDTQLDALPTAAEVRAEIDSNSTQLSGIKTKTDSLNFTVAGNVNANIHYINDVLVNGNGQSGTEWGP